MAVATKTLTPTNQVVNLPDMTEPPDNSVNVDNTGKLADAINELDSNVNKLKVAAGISVSSLNDIQSFLLGLTVNMESQEDIPVTIYINGNFSYFRASSNYSGVLHLAYKATNHTLFSCVLSSIAGDEVVVGYNDGTWVFNGISSKFHPEYTFNYVEIPANSGYTIITDVPQDVASGSISVLSPIGQPSITGLSLSIIIGTDDGAKYAYCDLSSYRSSLTGYSVVAKCHWTYS